MNYLIRRLIFAEINVCEIYFNGWKFYILPRYIFTDGEILIIARYVIFTPSIMRKEAKINFAKLRKIYALFCT